tara:strand:- start:290 stop:1216 length:927 start_codon:yes stop_codon:yes gene_type:complete
MHDRYSEIKKKLDNNEIIILDGGIGTELQKRGLAMDGSWSGTSSIHSDILKQIHIDYINSGSQVITTNTYASSRIMLEAAGYGDRFKEINLKAINAALDARNETLNDEIVIAGSLSHRYPIADGDLMSSASVKVSQSRLKEAADEMVEILSYNGCDLILLEMMYRPDRMSTIFDAAKKSNKPIWAGFSSRISDDGEILSLTDEVDVPFKDIVQIIKDYKLDAVGIMHTSVDIISESVSIIREIFDGPIMAYPNSGGWLSPNWTFDTVIETTDFQKKAQEWINQGVQIVGGCCGISTEHIKAISRGLKK